MSDVSEHAFIDLLGITKRYAGVTALDGVDFTVQPGEAGRTGRANRPSSRSFPVSRN